MRSLAPSFEGGIKWELKGTGAILFGTAVAQLLKADSSYPSDSASALLIATMLVALVLGAIVYAVR
jgi:hypothetical protein